MPFFDKIKKRKEAPVPKQTVGKENAPVSSKEKKVIKKDIGKTLGVLVRPLSTEKSSFVGQYGQYVFEINPKANKIEVAEAILNAYGVKPKSVNIINVKGKEVRYGRIKGKTKGRKKAIATLLPGEKIEVFEGV